MAQYPDPCPPEIAADLQKRQTQREFVERLFQSKVWAALVFAESDEHWEDAQRRIRAMANDAYTD